jgi:hypothetical protein
MPRRVLVLLAAGGALVLTGIVGIASSRPPTAGGDISLPDRIGDLPLVETESGQAAALEIGSLHGKTIPLVAAAVGHYGLSGEATLWVAAAASEAQAMALGEAMGEAIGQGRSPFTPLAPQVVSGATVYRLSGMGQEHMYFQVGRLVVWLAADPAVVESAGRTVVETFR